MISLKDLSPTDRAALLQEARAQIEQENIEKNAFAMYALKRKDLLTKTLEELNELFCIKKYNHKELLGYKDRVISITNYLYKMVKYKKTKVFNLTISTQEEWEDYVRILTNVKNMIVMSYQNENIISEENHDN